MIITSSLCIALSRLDGADEHGASRAFRLALKGVIVNPLPWAIGLGALASSFDFKLPAPLATTLGLLADAASPVALFTIGAVLARSQMNTTTPTRPRDYVPVVLIKLVLHPVLVALAGLSAIQLGLPLDRFALTVLVLLSALPSASNVSLLAERFGADNGRIARIILLSTVLAFFTFSGAVALVTGAAVF
jgi:predicted permease